MSEMTEPVFGMEMYSHACEPLFWCSSKLSRSQVKDHILGLKITFWPVFQSQMDQLD